MRRLWVPAPAGHRFQRVGGLAQRWADTFSKKYQAAGRPFAEPLLRRAIEVCQHLASAAETGTMANRDLHLGNILAAQREPWLVIDPKPLVGDPAFDAGHLVRSLLPERIAKTDVSRLMSSIARRLDLSPERIGEWVFVRSIENALWMALTGASDFGGAFEPNNGRWRFHWDVACAEATLP